VADRIIEGDIRKIVRIKFEWNDRGGFEVGKRMIEEEEPGPGDSIE
jgi:hypothetical protein